MNYLKDEQSTRLPRDFYRPLVEQFKRERLEYVVVRRPQSEWPRIQLLQDFGFRTIDSILGLEISTTRPPNPVPLATEVSFRPVAPSDRAHLGQLAESAFPTSRYYNDPVIPRAAAHSCFRAWGECGADGPAIVAIVGNSAPVGFISGRIDGQDPQVGVIELITVDPQFAGRGIASGLLAQFQTWGERQGLKKIYVQTHAYNPKGANLYLKSGFQLAKSFMTLRWTTRA